MKQYALSIVLILVTYGAAYTQTCDTGTIAASTPADRFTDYADGTVIDSATGLIWKVCSEGQAYNGTSGGCEGAAMPYAWQQALQRAAAVNATGFSGQSSWRLPNSKELSSIVERQCIGPAINLGIFPATPANVFWSASPYGNPTYALGVSFIDGATGTYFMSSLRYVRLVRGGQ
jgi:hypothetical protein